MYERTCSDLSTSRAVAKPTYEVAVELFAMLCKQYNLNPTADGVIVSRREGHSRGIASNHGDPKHLWNGLDMGYIMDGFRKEVKEAIGESVAESVLLLAAAVWELPAFQRLKVLIPDLN